MKHDNTLTTEQKSELIIQKKYRIIQRKSDKKWIIQKKHWLGFWYHVLIPTSESHRISMGPFSTYGFRAKYFYSDETKEHAEWLLYYGILNRHVEKFCGFTIKSYVEWSSFKGHYILKYITNENLDYNQYKGGYGWYDKNLDDLKKTLESHTKLK